MPSFTSFGRMLALAALVAPVIACGDDDDLTGVNITANVRVVIDDDPSRETPPAPGPRDEPEAGPFGGTYAGTARVQLSAGGGEWIDVGGPTGVNLAVQTGDSASFGGTVTLPAATYNRARLILRGSQLRLHGNVLGVVLTDALLNVEGTEVTIERQIAPVTISAATNARIAFDLNTEGWLTTANAASRVITTAQVEAAVEGAAATTSTPTG